MNKKRHEASDIYHGEKKLRVGEGGLTKSSAVLPVKAVAGLAASPFAEDMLSAGAD